MRYASLVQRSKGQAGLIKEPQYYNQCIFDVYQLTGATDDILICPIPQSSTKFGMGNFKCASKAGTGLSEVFITLDSSDVIEAEARDVALAEGSSKVTWYKVGDNASNTTGLFEFSSPFTFLKFKFNGTGGGRIILALN